MCLIKDSILLIVKAKSFSLLELDIFAVRILTSMFSVRVEEQILFVNHENSFLRETFTFLITLSSEFSNDLLIESCYVLNVALRRKGYKEKV